MLFIKVYVFFNISPMVGATLIKSIISFLFSIDQDNSRSGLLRVRPRNDQYHRTIKTAVSATTYRNAKWLLQQPGTASGNVAGASCALSSCRSRSNVWEPLPQQKQRPGALQERPVAPAATRYNVSVREHCRNALWLLQHPGTTSGRVAGAPCGYCSRR